jgi:ABC-type sugar transport system substrate-binding protein
VIDSGPTGEVIAQVAQAIKQHPNVKCLVGLNTSSAAKLLAALGQLNKVGQIQVVGFDAARETLDGIAAGSVVATVVQDQFGCGFNVVRILAEKAQGNRSGLPMFQRRTLPVKVVNKENVGRVMGELANERPATKPG